MSTRACTHCGAQVQYSEQANGLCIDCLARLLDDCLDAFSVIVANPHPCCRAQEKRAWLAARWPQRIHSSQ